MSSVTSRSVECYVFEVSSVTSRSVDLHVRKVSSIVFEICRNLTIVLECSEL